MQEIDSIVFPVIYNLDYNGILLGNWNWKQIRKLELETN